MKKIKILISLFVLGISTGNVFAQPEKDLGVDSAYHPVRRILLDYVILANSNDTVLCDIKVALLTGKPSYKTFEDGAKFKNITPKVVKEYYIISKGDTYQAIVNADKDGESFFAKVIERGKINLFEVVSHSSYTSSFGFGSPATTSHSKDIAWYISKGSGVVLPVKFNNVLTGRNKREKILEEMLADNEEASEKYAANKLDFTFKQIKNLVHFYNTGVWLRD